MMMKTLAEEPLERVTLKEYQKSMSENTQICVCYADPSLLLYGTKFYYSSKLVRFGEEISN